MKILCDVCGKEEALVFCCADEAALCDACDRRVHHANKLAGKHRRLTFSAPSAQSHPVCDICQEKRGFLFCQEDRAILCRDCDAPIHSANHLTMKHNRFLLTGVRLSAAPISSSASGEADEVTKAKASPTVQVSNQNKVLVVMSTPAATSAGEATAPKFSAATGSINQNKYLVPENSFTAASSNTNTPTNSVATTGAATNNGHGSASASSISEYLMKMCPGWHVEDLLVDDAAAAAIGGFSKVDELLPFLEADLDSSGIEAMAGELPHLWAPHVPQFPPPALAMSSDGGGGAAASAALYQPWVVGKEAGVSYQHHMGARPGRDHRSEDVFMVPQISPVSSASSKRARHSDWY